MFRALLLASAMLLTANSASAQEDVLAEMYGRGVHHYYAGDYLEAHRFLSMAIDNGTRDPRPYFFRGLVLDATGRPEEAEADYRAGAVLETQSNTGSLVGRSLARVQGSRRLEIERIRQEARLTSKIEQQTQARARYEEREASEAQTLRNRPRPSAAVPPPSPATPPAEPDAVAEDLRSNPFADDGGTAAGVPTVEAEDALGDPLAEEAATAETEAPSGSPPAAPVDADDDIFGLGGDDDAGGDVFGTEMDDSDPAEVPADDEEEEEAPVDDPFDFDF